MPVRQRHRAQRLGGRRVDVQGARGRRRLARVRQRGHLFERDERGGDLHVHGHDAGLQLHARRLSSERAMGEPEEGRAREC